jgi:hypothetical protein
MKVMLTSIIVALVLVLSAVSQEADILAVFSFENGDPEDTKGNNDDLTLYGEPKSVSGKVGEALYFDGEDDFIELSKQDETKAKFTHPAFQARTVTMFFKADDVEGEHTLFEEGAHLNGIIIAIMEKELRLGTMDNSQQFTIAVPFEDTSDWHHVVGVFDNGKVFLYLDGQKVADGETPYKQITEHGDEAGIAATADGDAFGVTGTNPGPPKKFFKGILDEVTIYTRALTAAEVQKLAAALSVESEQSLSTMWGDIKTNY